jgi:hypothetical protein
MNQISKVFVDPTPGGSSTRHFSTNKSANKFPRIVLSKTSDASRSDAAEDSVTPVSMPEFDRSI